MYKFFLPIIILLIALWLIIGIQQENEKQVKDFIENYDSNSIEATIDDKVILLPDYMYQVYNLNDDAELQYQSNDDDLYCIGIYEDKSTLGEYTISDYYNYITNYFTNDVLVSGESTEPLFKEINGYNSAQGYITGDFYSDNETLNIYYRLAIYETDTKYYQFLVWTLGENREKYENIMNEILISFKDKN